MTTEEGLRERKKRETRAALSQAAIRLCADRGWDNVTVDDIAAAADVSVRTFRNYFTSKAEAVAAVHGERTLRIADSLRVHSDMPLWDAVLAAVATQFDLGTAPPARVAEWWSRAQEVLTQPAVHGEVLKASVAAEAELARAVGEHTGLDPAVDVYPNLVAAAIGMGIAVALRQWITTDPLSAAMPHLADVFAQIRAGLPERNAHA
jgi:AcrR family transcriptional regulator